MIHEDEVFMNDVFKMGRDIAILFAIKGCSCCIVLIAHSSDTQFDLMTPSLATELLIRYASCMILDGLFHISFFLEALLDRSEGSKEQGHILPSRQGLPEGTEKAEPKTFETDARMTVLVSYFVQTFCAITDPFAPPLGDWLEVYGVDSVCFLLLPIKFES